MGEKEIKPCPCGKTPKQLSVNHYYTEKWAHVSGDCCGDWETEFRTQYAKGEELMELARLAWNNASRPI